MNYQIDEIYHFSNKRGQNDQYMDWFYDGEKPSPVRAVLEFARIKNQR